MRKSDPVQPMRAKKEILFISFTYPFFYPQTILLSFITFTRSKPFFGVTLFMGHYIMIGILLLFCFAKYFY